VFNSFSCIVTIHLRLKTNGLIYKTEKLEINAVTGWNNQFSRIGQKVTARKLHSSRLAVYEWLNYTTRFSVWFDSIVQGD